MRAGLVYFILRRSVFSKSGGREKKVKEKRNGKSGAKRRYVSVEEVA